MTKLGGKEHHERLNQYRK